MFKKITLIIFTVIFISISLLYAKCGRGYATFKPFDENVYKDSIFILESDIKLEISTLNNLKLISKSETVPLTLLEENIGMFHANQYLLKPEKELIIEDTYELNFDSLPKDNFLYQSFSRMKNIKYSIINKKTYQKPEWINNPEEISKTKIHFGCGPEANNTFSIKIKKNETIMIKANVLDLETNLKISYVLPINDNTIAIGHGMCSGPFLLDELKNYQVTFDILQNNGEIIQWQGKPIPFKAPNDLDRGKIKE